MVHSYHYRSFFLSTLGLIFCSAFLSYYVQFPGLLSSSGIEPVGRSIHFVFPNLSQWLEERLGGDKDLYWAELDVMCDLIAIVGVVLSCIVASGWIHHGIFFVTITTLYCFLVKVGGTFYSFQWDILLLECGFITSICYAPWSRRNYTNIKNNMDGNTGTWPLRFLLFKLMFMSGVVKILADCPTWINLTALEYHFATQCLPGPLAWYTHQLHPFLLRLSVAMTLIIEIPMSFLLIVPIGRWRRVGVYFQLILQFMIILSGNYNFFNLLTMALCIPCLEHHEHDHNQQDDDKVEKKNNTRPQNNYQYFDVSICFVILAWCFNKMFTIEYVDGHKSQQQYMNISLAMTKHGCEKMIKDIVPIAIISSFTFLIHSGIKRMVTIHRARTRTTKISFLVMTTTSFFHIVLCILCLGMSSVPFLQVIPGLDQQLLMEPVKTFIQPFQIIQPYGLSNGYGLFRRMTGVGKNNNQLGLGWAGVQPSIVERPEIIVEGFSMKNNDWRELKFRWKPGNVNDMPKQVAPHQPRLDWQMWFAALGSYQNNPWFINFINKLLDGCKPVIHLLNEPELESGEDKLLGIRSLLYNYDFTRIDTEWNRNIPGTTILPTKMQSSKSQSQQHDDPWWKRNYERDYLPSFEPNNESVQSFLSNYGYSSSKCHYQEHGWCQGKTHPTLCHFSFFVRQYHLVWIPIFSVILYWYMNIKI